MASYQVPNEFAYGGSYVDESLFGESRAKKTAARRRAGQSLLNNGVSQPPHSQAITLSRAEYEAIVRRANTPLAALQTTQKKSKKQHRVEIGMLHKEKPTPAQEYERQYRETVGIGGANIRAFELRNEELDEVKELETHLTMMRIKKEVDHGVALKKQRQRQIEDYEERKNLEMEERRLREIRREQELHAKKQQQAKSAQQQLLDQIAYNKQLELLEEERLAQENKQMRAHLQALEAKEEQKKAQQREAAAQRAVELARSNRMAEKYRVIAKEQSEKEDQDISAYLRKKAQAEEFRRIQQEKLRREEELNVARMRELREKQNDKQAEEDAKKALQYQEQRQLREEEQIAQREAQRAAMQKSVLEELENQKRLKQRLDYQEKIRDEEYVARLQREALEVNRRSDQEQRRRLDAREQYKQDLVDLMKRREMEAREKERLQLERDRRDALEGDVYKHRVNLVIQKKLKQHAENYPVPARYAPDAEAKREAKREATQKFHKTRALW